MNEDKSFEEFCNETKIRETFIEEDKSNIVFEGTMNDYFKICSDDEITKLVFKLFYNSSFENIKCKNAYGNYHFYEIIQILD